jgi:hypothetical protein
MPQQNQQALIAIEDIYKQACLYINDPIRLTTPTTRN